MPDRANLKEILEEILGSTRVYFQPPSTLKYPCIICDKTDYDYDHGDNIKYRFKTHYTITLIGKNFDTEEIVKKILKLDYCSYDRRFISDNLYHDVFDLYY